MLLREFVLGREQLHRQLAAIERGLPARARELTDHRSADVWDALFGDEGAVVQQWARCEQIWAAAGVARSCLLVLQGSVEA